MACDAMNPDELILVSSRADDHLVARAYAAHRGIRYRWAVPAWTRWRSSLSLRWGAELLFRVRMAKLVVRGFLARVMRRNSLAGRSHTDLLFNTWSSTWNVAQKTDRVLGPLLAEARAEGLSVTGLHLDHRRNLGLDTLRRLDSRIVAWESLVTPGVAIRALAAGRRIARGFGGAFPGEVHGIPAASLLTDRLPVLFGARLADAILAIETCGTALQALKPRCVYIVDAYDLWGRALVVAAREQGISTIEAQHGIIGESHDGYLHLPGEVSPSHDQRTPFSPIPDQVAVHGEAPKEALVKHGKYPAESIVITGSPQIEALRQRQETNVEARRALGLREDRLLVLFFGAPYHVFPADQAHVQAFLSCCRSMPEITPLLRPHPAEYTGERYVEAAREAGVDAPVLSKADPFELIVASDIVISHNSTTALDAMALHRPVIHINMSGTPDLFPFVDDAGALSARSENELRTALASLAGPGARATAVARTDPYAVRYYARCQNPARALLDAGLRTTVPA